MMNLVANIEQLLVQHGHVAFPGIGIFSVYEKPAHISATAITPRLTAIRFQPKANCNDGILSQWLMEKQNISYRDAMKLIATNAEKILSDLNEGNVILGSLGTLFRADQTLYFISSEAKFLPQNLGLSPVSAARLSNEQAKPNTITIQLPSHRSEIFKYVAAASIAFVLMIFAPNTQNPYNLNASLMPFKLKMEPPVQLTLSEATETIENSETTMTIAEPIKVTQYHVVVASLRSRQQAESFVARNKAKMTGIHILDGKNVFRVVSGSYSNLSDAVTSMRQIRTTTPYTSAWVYTK